VKADDPAGMLPKILSGGWYKFFRVRSTSLINSIRLFVVGIILLVHEQADVTAIRFSPASPPDLGKFPRESEALHRVALLS
jgi:hypothetical protein